MAQRIYSHAQACANDIGYEINEKQALMLAKRYTVQAYHAYLIRLLMSGNDYAIDRHIMWLEQYK